jgi:hypothetical protein
MASAKVTLVIAAATKDSTEFADYGWDVGDVVEKAASIPSASEDEHRW